MKLNTSLNRPKYSTRSSILVVPSAEQVVAGEILAMEKL
jgi:hypothetical protein